MQSFAPEVVRTRANFRFKYPQHASFILKKKNKKIVK